MYLHALPGLCCCTRCLDARLVFFAEYKVPPNKPGGKDSRCHEAYARGYVYLQNWMRAWMAACEEGVDGLHLYSCIIYELNIFYLLSFLSVDHDIEQSRTQCIERMAENIPRLLYHTYVKDWLKVIRRSCVSENDLVIRDYDIPQTSHDLRLMHRLCHLVINHEISFKQRGSLV
ncbi:hypothetical protein B0H13DRAFT_1869174, partial [Mycena leptocephala]